MKEAIGVGATPELALADACAKLGKESHEVEYELLEMAEKKLFGLFGGRPAKVRAYISETEDIKAEIKAELTAAIAPEVKEPKAKAAEPAKKPEKKAEKKPENKPVETAAPAPVEVPAVEEKPAEEKPAAAENADQVSPVDAAVTYLRKVLDQLGAVNIDITVKEKEDGAELTLTGEDASMIIGHHGETLSALTYLVGLVANHVQESYYRITLNTGNYREKREQTLQRLAKRMAAKAVATGRRQSLEPMNPYERRIIHTAVQEVDGAISWSEGVDLSRHVVIGPAEGVRPTRTRNNNNNRRNDRRGGSNNNRRSNDRRSDNRKPNRSANGYNNAEQRPVGDRPQISDVVSTTSCPEEIKPAATRPAAKPATKPAAKTTYAKESASVPLYGRIDVKK